MNTVRSKTLQIRVTPKEQKDVTKLARTHKQTVSGYLYKNVKSLLRGTPTNSDDDDDWLND